MALLGPALATDVAFAVVFAVFVLALLVLAVLAIRWGARRDRPGRDAWKARHAAGQVGSAPPAPNGSGLLEDRGERQ